MNVQRLGPEALVCDKAHGQERVELLPTRCERMRLNVDRSWNKLDIELRKTFLDLCNGMTRWPLYLYGDAGRGKTLAGLCFCDAMRDAAFMEVEGLCEAIKYREDYHWTAVRERQFIVLDELAGTDQVTGLEYQAVKRFADLRESWGNRVAVYITNHPPEHIKHLFDRRIHSRITCGTVFLLEGPDRRLE